MHTTRDELKKHQTKVKGIKQKGNSHTIAITPIFFPRRLLNRTNPSIFKRILKKKKRVERNHAPMLEFQGKEKEKPRSGMHHIVALSLAHMPAYRREPATHERNRQTKLKEVRRQQNDPKFSTQNGKSLAWVPWLFHPGGAPTPCVPKDPKCAT
ncbi:hypothetical protein VTN00DRAFT_3957 [Thermoascus crustaceus]|uniref:uncharacterized protein n=1 Tax=Thermoascus crustaceus TaxID=5088 RepID=UPI00374323B4